MTPYEFFYEHAGWSWLEGFETRETGHERTARELAAAEVWADDAGVEFRWEWDEELFDDLGQPMTYCAAFLGRDVLASLGGIEDNVTPDYRRVIQAELALEARALILDDLAKL